MLGARDGARPRCLSCANACLLSLANVVLARCLTQKVGDDKERVVFISHGQIAIPYLFDVQTTVQAGGTDHPPGITIEHGGRWGAT